MPSILAGCAPCQPFSSYKQRYAEDPQWGLISSFAKIAVGVNPDFITMENVPSLLRYKEGKVFSRFCNSLKRGGYLTTWNIVNCEEFGVPQKRKRLVVIASKHKEPLTLEPTSRKKRTVRDAIGNLPAIKAGGHDPKDRMHTSSSLTPINQKRIKASIPGGTWRDWPLKLRAKCHQKDSGKTYPGVYGRMKWEEPSPTITTQCFGYGNGRFGHPQQNRALSLREAAILQTFPKSYKFLPEEEAIHFTEIGRWVGNAVPVNLAEAIGRKIVNSM